YLSSRVYISCYYDIMNSHTAIILSDATATPYSYTLSLHDALPIYGHGRQSGPAQDEVRRQRGHGAGGQPRRRKGPPGHLRAAALDRKSTRLNSSHVKISYAVFCLTKKII